VTDETKRRLEILKAAVQDHRDNVEHAEREIPELLEEIDLILLEDMEFEGKRNRYVYKRNTDAK
jgi:hypothetical protein